MAAVAIVAAVPALYTHSDERCWETIRYPDGSEETRLTDRFGGGVVGLLEIPVETPRGTGTAVAGGCVSNVVTAREAVLSLIIASGGVVILLSVARLGHREGSAPR